MTDTTVSLSSDEDGFISRECPTCVGLFKAQVVDGNITVHFCPYCGHEGDDSWWTPEQLEFIQKAAAEAIRPELEQIAREFESHSGGFLKITADLSPLEPAVAPHETPDTMETNFFPCCGARAKLERSRLSGPEGREAQAYCVMCGTPSELERPPG